MTPSTTAVHMVQLPNPPNNSFVATANGLPINSGSSVGVNSSSNNNGNAAGGDASRRTHEQQQPQQQDEAGKASGSSSSEDAPMAFSSATGLEITTATAGNGGGNSSSSSSSGSVSTSGLLRSELDNSAPTFVSTPSVSIFQVANRPTGNNSSGAVLQPVAAVTGFNPPNARLKVPAATSGARRAPRATPVRPTLPPAATNTTGDLTLAQLLSHSPNTNNVDSSNFPSFQSNQTFNGPSQQVAPSKPTGKGRGSKRGSSSSSTTTARVSDTVAASILATSTSSVSAGDVGLLLSSSSVTCSPGGPPIDFRSTSNVPLVKYVDLNSVSGPTRPRPGSTTGIRRPSAGSNSNSPDPHRSAKSRASVSSSQNPASPALVNSPQSPALQAPPSPLSFRKQQHSHVYAGAIKSGSGDRLASPSHPSQCSSPFSRPSSRSQV